MAVHLVGRRRLLVGAQFAARQRDAEAVALHQAGHAHRFGDVRIAVRQQAGLAEVLRRDVAVGAARVDDFDVPVEPIDLYRAVAALVAAVHHGVAHQLLQRRQRIGGAAHFGSRLAHRHRGAHVGAQDRVEGGHRLAQGGVDAGAVEDGVAAFFPGNAQELHVGTGQEVGWRFAQHQHAEYRGRGFVGAQDHLGGGEALLHRAVVPGQHFRAERLRQVEKLEPPQIQVVQRGGADGMDVERRVAVASLLAQDAFVLRAGDGAARADAGPNAASAAHRGRIGRRHRDHRHIAAAEGVLVDGHGRQGQDVAVRLAVRELEQQGVVYLQAGGRAVVADADEDHAGATVVRQVVGERANRLSHGVRRFAVERLLALDEIGFDIDEQRR